MAEPDESPKAAPRGSRKGLILAVFLTLAGAGAGFAAGFLGLVPMPGGHGDSPAAAQPAVAFVAIEPVVISVSGIDGVSHLRFAAQIEVDPAHLAEVGALTPRILDVFNSYLRAVDPTLFGERAALVKVRAQLLRRIQLILGPDRARDLLVTEFVLN
jgi:flagellar protein FliL